MATQIIIRESAKGRDTLSIYNKVLEQIKKSGKLSGKYNKIKYLLKDNNLILF